MNPKKMLALEYLAKQYDEVNIPLYLSYPVSSWWQTPVDEEIFAGEYSNTRNPFLYFHFPYCRKACYYCTCYKAVSDKPDKNDRYLRFLEKEFLYKLDLLGIQGFEEVSQMHWGGGTPTHLTLSQMEKIFNIISRYIRFSDGNASSISIEAHPDKEDLSFDKLRLLKDMGFNEISFGIQDFDERIQKVINRDTSKEVVGSMIEMSKELGFRVHVDLCYGLPFQGQNELERTIESVIQMSPDRVALFTYAHYPLAYPIQRNIPTMSIPNSFVRVLMAILAESLFLSNGYHKIGYDHYVKQGNSLHAAKLEKNIIRDFMGYSSIKRRQFLGFGNAAISFIGKGFFQNQLTLEDYYARIKENKFPVQETKGHLLSKDDEVRNMLIQQYILGDFSIQMEKISQSFGIDFKSYFKKELERLDDLNHDGLVEYPDSETIALTPTGKYFSRHVAKVFDTYF